MTRRALALALWISLAFAAPAWGNCANGADRAVATANGVGQILVSWQATQVTEGFCTGRGVAAAAIGSTATGFVDVGTLRAVPTGAFLDDAGDGWVVGLNEKFGDFRSEGPLYEPTGGAWFAFRPAGGHFRHPVELPNRSSSEPPLIAGDQAGATVLAWEAQNGAYLAWGTASGALSKPVFYGRGFRITEVAVDESGRALIAGYYPDPRFYNAAKAIAVITGPAGSFSRPRVIAVRPHDARRRFLGTLRGPVMAMGPEGQAVIAWEAALDPNLLGHASDVLVYRHANGHLDKPIRFANGFLEFSSPGSGEESKAVVDGAGRTLIISAREHGVEEVTVEPGIRVAPRRLIAGPGFESSIAGNALGETAIAWVNGTYSIKAIDVSLGNTQGATSAPQAISLPPETIVDKLTVIVGPEGGATVVWVNDSQANEGAVYARTLTPGAQTIQVAGSGAIS